MMVYIAHCADVGDFAKNLCDQIKLDYAGLEPHSFAVDQLEFSDTERHFLSDSRMFIVIYSNNMTEHKFADSAVSKYAPNAEQLLVWSPRQLRGQHRETFTAMTSKFALCESWGDLVGNVKKFFEAHKEKIEQDDKVIRINSKFSEFLNPNGLVYIRFGQLTSKLAAVDILDEASHSSESDTSSPNEESIIRGIMQAAGNTPEKQRKYYDDTINGFINEFNNWNRQLEPWGQEKLDRVVFDVMAGAAYIYVIHGTFYLAGVTANQFKVHECDREIADIRDFIRNNL